MSPTLRRFLTVLLAGATFAPLAGCSSSHLLPPEPQGPPAMVDDGGEPRLWVLSKQEEERQVAVGSRRNSGWREDTFFHFEVRAFDPVTARPLWSKRLWTIGDPKAAGFGPSRVIGSAVDGRLLGQEGDRVWLLLGGEPVAVRAADGSVVANSQTIQQRNPELEGLMPADAGHYGFDQGLVFMSADARRFVVRGDDALATPYAPTPAPVPPPRLKSNGMPVIEPMRPLMPAPLRLIELGGQWLGLYSEKEAADAAEDSFGENLQYPYSILDEGAKTRRGFWRVQVQEAERFEERFRRIGAVTPVPEAPVFLNGRFLKLDLRDEPLRLQNPAGVAVWHLTRIDSQGRLALTRLDEQLKTLWRAELPLSESGIANPVRTWVVGGHLVAVGNFESESEHMTSREQHLVSVDMATGAVQAWNFEREAAVP
jgi:hypothetical protein